MSKMFEEHVDMFLHTCVKYIFRFPKKVYDIDDIKSSFHNDAYKIILKLFIANGNKALKSPSMTSCEFKRIIHQNYDKTLSCNASLFLLGGLEYICTELTDVCGREASKRARNNISKKSLISANDIKDSISRHDELNALHQVIHSNVTNYITESKNIVPFRNLENITLFSKEAKAQVFADFFPQFIMTTAFHEYTNMLLLYCTKHLLRGGSNTIDREQIIKNYNYKPFINTKGNTRGLLYYSGFANAIKKHFHKTLLTKYLDFICTRLKVLLSK